MPTFFSFLFFTVRTLHVGFDAFRLGLEHLALAFG